MFNILPCSPETWPGCTMDSGLPWPNTPPKDLEPARCLVVSNVGGGGPIVLEMELRAMSDCASVSSTTEGVCMLWVLWTLFAFLESASRGSSWQRWPILRLIHLVHGLSYPWRQSHSFDGVERRTLPLKTRTQRLQLRCRNVFSEREKQGLPRILLTRSQVIC